MVSIVSPGAATQAGIINLGACYRGDGRCRFLVWAPLASRVDLHVVAPDERSVPMAPSNVPCAEKVPTCSSYMT